MLNMYNTIEGNVILEFEKVVTEFGCGVASQINLSDNTSDPATCGQLALESPLCGEFFEVLEDLSKCRCAPKTHICLMKDSAKTTIYRLMEKRGSPLLYIRL